MDLGERILSQTTHMATKTHTCYICQDEIKVGELYKREVVLDFNHYYKGRIITYKTHAEECAYRG